jgi:MFS family permease
VIVAVAFVTMGVAVNARTSFSLLFPAILDEFGWDRGVTAGAFSLGFLVSAVLSPLIGRLHDRAGPRVVIETGVLVMTAGLVLASFVRQPWQLYATLGLLAGAGGNCLGYTAHALFLPRWFVRRRGLAMSVAFSGVGVGSIVVLPWLQTVIGQQGWRAACWQLGVVAVVLLLPLNLLLRRGPEDLALRPDGDSCGVEQRAARLPADESSAARDWTLARALRTSEFWWIAAAYAGGMFSWYAVQVHQTRYLVDIGFSAADAAWALAGVSVVAVPGQIALGQLSDRIGREWVWTVGSLGFVVCYAMLLLMAHRPTPARLYVMVAAQGALGYGLTSVIGAIPADIFEGPHYGTIFGTLMLSAIAGGAAGPWVAGLLHDLSGSYTAAFWTAIGCSTVSAVAVWVARGGSGRAAD